MGAEESGRGVTAPLEKPEGGMGGRGHPRPRARGPGRIACHAVYAGTSYARASSAICRDTPISSRRLPRRSTAICPTPAWTIWRAGWRGSPESLARRTSSFSMTSPRAMHATIFTVCPYRPPTCARMPSRRSGSDNAIPRARAPYGKRSSLCARNAAASERRPVPHLTDGTLPLCIQGSGWPPARQSDRLPRMAGRKQRAQHRRDTIWNGNAGRDL